MLEETLAKRLAVFSALACLACIYSNVCAFGPPLFQFFITEDKIAPAAISHRLELHRPCTILRL